MFVNALDQITQDSLKLVCLQDLDLLSYAAGSDFSHETLRNFMLAYSEQNSWLVVPYVLRPFVLNFSTFFRYKSEYARWPTLSDLREAINLRFRGFIDPVVLEKKNTLYTCRKIAESVPELSADIKSRSGPLMSDRRITDWESLLDAYSVYFREHVCSQVIWGSDLRDFTMFVIESVSSLNPKFHGVIADQILIQYYVERERADDP